MASSTITITPRGVTSSRLSAEEFKRLLKSEFSKIRYIVGSELRIKVFDKTLGIFWLFLEPLMMAAVYYVLTSVILGSRIAPKEFFGIYVAVVFWRWFSKTIDNAPGVFAGYASVLKQTNFPVYSIVLSFISLEFSLWCLSFLVLTGFLAIFGIFPSFAHLYLPLVLIAQFSLILFLTLCFSMIGIFFKDLGGMLYALTSVWFYLSPGIYPISRIPERYLWIYNLNPFAHLLPAYRTILLEHAAPPLLPLLVITVIFYSLTYLGFKALGKVRYHFFGYL